MVGRGAAAALLAVLLCADPAAPQIERGFVDVDGGRLYYEATGDGPPVILLHDGTAHSIIWDRQFPALSDRWRLIRYDRRGYGRSARPDTSYSNAADLRAVMDHLGVERAVIVGGSAGGRLATEFAIRHPDRVGGLVLVGAVAGGLAPSEHFHDLSWSRADPVLNADRTAILDPLPDSAIAEMARRFAEDPYLISPANVEAREWLRRTVREHASNVLNPGRWMIWLDPPAVGRLGEIEAPTLIVVGVGDHPDLHAHAGALQAGIRGSERVLVEGAAHLPQLERPREFNRLLAAFLERRADWSTPDPRR